MSNVYCAGPLFNSSERKEMKAISKILKSASFNTFLPHEDGLEFSRLQAVLQRLGTSELSAGSILNRAIFSFDVYKLLNWSDAVVANLNGRVPDEGTIVESALAWYSGKAVVLYKNDDRSLINGFDNPMLGGLGKFRVVDRIHDLPEAINEQLTLSNRNQVEEAISLGEKISTTLSQVPSQGVRKPRASTARLIHSLFRDQQRI